MFIDSPKDFLHITKETQTITFRGWKLCDDEEAEFVVCVGNEKVQQIKFTSRPDVMEIYHEQYSGLVDEKCVGFSANIDINKCRRNIDNNTGLKLKAMIIQKNGNILAEKEVVVVLDGEQ